MAPSTRRTRRDVRSDEEEDDVQIRRRPRATRRAVRIISEPSSASDADDESPSDDDDENLAALQNRLLDAETAEEEEADVPVRSPRTARDDRGGRYIERAYSFTAHSPNGPPCMVDADGLKKVQAALEHLGATYSVSIERGPVCGTLHYQGVVRLMSTSATNANNLITKQLQWKNKKGYYCKLKSLTGIALHFWEGMLGYSLKDEHKPHFVTVRSANVTEEELDRGREAYLKYGAGEVKKRDTINYTNMFAKMEMWWRHKMNCDMEVDITLILRDMMRSGKFFPDARWITPSYGLGVDPHRSRTMFRMVRDYENVTEHDIKVIFFTPTFEDYMAERAYPSRYQRTNHHVHPVPPYHWRTSYHTSGAPQNGPLSPPEAMEFRNNYRMFKKRVFKGSPVRPPPTPAPDVRSPPWRSPLWRIKDRLLTIGRKILRRASASKAQERTPPREEEEEVWCMFSDGGERTKRRIIFGEDLREAQEAFEQRQLESALQEIAEEDAEAGYGGEYRESAEYR